jgi:DNA invertase Pin-like site-specific DNA recombinase
LCLGLRKAEISKRIDIIAAALFQNAAVEDINDMNLSYTPPFSSPRDPSRWPLNRGSLPRATPRFLAKKGWTTLLHRARSPIANERVSTDGQSVDAQVKQLRDAGAEKVFRETASGARSDRAQLRRALDQFDKGDVLMVTRLDRLARSTRDLLNTMAFIADRRAGFRSLGDAWADTTTAHGRLMLAVLGGLAEFERELIAARTGEGRERAKARGVKMGPKFKLTPHQQREAIRRRDVKGEPVREIARTFNVSHSTISRLKA